MIDLHTHTNRSDGTLSPEALIAEASRIGLQAIAITDHDTFAGYDKAKDLASNIAVELVCGIELSAKYCGRTVDLLAYFLNGGPNQEFRDWLAQAAESRHRRNLDLIDELCRKGIRISLEEVEQRADRVVARPHFAAVMVEKGYVSSIQEAFDRYLAESGSCFVERTEPEFEEVIRQVAISDGLTVLAHPGRLLKRCAKETLKRMRALGLMGIEVYHSDHSTSDCTLFSSLARELGIAATGGSDFHGMAKPRISLGTGIDGNLSIPYLILEDLKRAAS